MNYQLDYFYGKEAEQFNFLRITKLLFRDERFKGLSRNCIRQNHLKIMRMITKSGKS